MTSNRASKPLLDPRLFEPFPSFAFCAFGFTLPFPLFLFELGFPFNTLLMPTDSTFTVLELSG